MAFVTVSADCVSFNVKYSIAFDWVGTGAVSRMWGKEGKQHHHKIEKYELIFVFCESILNFNLSFEFSIELSALLRLS